MPAQDQICRDIAIDTKPRLQCREAIAAATASLGKAIETSDSKAELVVYPAREQVHVGPGTNAMDYEYRVAGYRLAYVVSQHSVPRAPNWSRVTIIDAQTGAVLKQWDPNPTAK